MTMRGRLWCGVMCAAALGLGAGAARFQPPAAAPAPTQAATTLPAPKWLNAEALRALEASLPEPVKDGNPVLRGEIELMLAIRGEASEAAKWRAKSEEVFTVWTFADVLGPGFNETKFPRTGALLYQASIDSANVTAPLKARWARAPPPMQDPRITPLVAVPTDAAHPSGHAVRAMLWARLLTRLAPEREQELLQRARLVAYGRVVAGVHFPTDV